VLFWSSSTLSIVGCKNRSCFLAGSSDAFHVNGDIDGHRETTNTGAPCLVPIGVLAPRGKHPIAQLGNKVPAVFSPCAYGKPLYRIGNYSLLLC
jgi:hypothetical protein